MASRVSCFRETARQGRPRLVRAFLYLSIYQGAAKYADDPRTRDAL